MLDVKRLTIIIFTVLFILVRVTSVHYLVYVIAGVIYLGILFYGSFYIGSNFYLTVIRAVKTSEKKIAITFDDGPDEKNTPKILQLLNKFGIKAAFFVVGRKIQSNPELLKRIDEMGHIIGNHTYNHSNWFDFYTFKKMIVELDETEKLINDLIGKKVKFFRPPYGVTNPALAKAVKNMNYTPIGWNVRSLDTGKSKKADRIYNRIVRKLKPGSIILLHDKNPEIESVIEKLVLYANENNYEIVRLDKLMNDEAYV